MPKNDFSPQEMALAIEDQVQCSPDGSTIWVHALDGTTVGRFSRLFGMDVHTTFTQQMAGASQCLHCTHEPATEDDWNSFCDLILEHYKITVDRSLVKFATA